MSGIIFCRSRYSKRPYYIASADINVYSLEELNYYLYNNVFVIGKEFFCQKLYDFIENDIGEEELAKELSTLDNGGADTTELVMTTLMYTDYYSNEEVEKIVHVIEQMDSRSNHERMKCRGDAFLSGKKYDQAIHCYRDILECGYEEKAEQGFYGKVWYNLGTSYARMMEFGEASKCFMEAYDILKDDQSYASYYDALLLGGTNNKPVDGLEVQDMAAAENSKVCSNQGQEISSCWDSARCREELMRVMQIYDEAGKSEEYSEMTKLAELKKQGKAQEYSAKKREIINRWKKDYRDYMR